MTMGVNDAGGDDGICPVDDHVVAAMLELGTDS